MNTQSNVKNNQLLNDTAYNLDQFFGKIKNEVLTKIEDNELTDESELNKILSKIKNKKLTHEININEIFSEVKNDQLTDKLKIAIKSNPKLNKLLEDFNQKTKVPSNKDVFSSVYKEFPLSYIKEISDILKVEAIELLIPVYTPSAVVKLLPLKNINVRRIVKLAEQLELFEFSFKATRIFRVVNNESLSSSTVVFSPLGVLDFYQSIKKINDGKALLEKVYSQKETNFILNLK